jgi:shikimate dehydrogenase
VRSRRGTAMHQPPRNLSALRASTRLTAIFGDPIEHSLSPEMHNAAYAALGMDRAYVAFRVAPTALRAALAAIPALGIAGVNLTVPLKETAARMIRDLSDEARLLGAVNCVINRRGKLRGDNTDARGLERDLRRLGSGVARRKVIVIGAGGAAASAVLAAIRLRAANIVIANRTPARAAHLARRLATASGGRVKIEASGLDALRDHAVLCDAAIIINATSMGLTTARFAQLDYAATPRGCLFYDMIYSARPTAFLRPARRTRHRTADGAGMLAAQGELAFKLFNGVAPPKGVMASALMRALGRRVQPPFT